MQGADFSRSLKQIFHTYLAIDAQLLFFILVQRKNVVDHSPLRNVLREIFSKVQLRIRSPAGLFGRSKDEAIWRNNILLEITIGAHLGQIIHRLMQPQTFVHYSFESVSDNLHCHISEIWGWKKVCKRILRSEEHTSELQSRRDLVCRLLLEKKK